MPDPEIHIIDARRAGPLDWSMVAEEFYQAQQKGVSEIKLDVPDYVNSTNILEFINAYCAGRRIGISEERISGMLDIGTWIMESTRNFLEAQRARPGAPSRGGDQG